MSNPITSTLSLAVASSVIALACAPVDAAIIVVSNSMVFDSIVASMNGSTLHENFASYSGYYASGLAGGTGDSSWTAAASGDLYSDGGIMSTNTAIQPMTFTFASDNVFAIGGNFFNTNTDFSMGGGFVSVAVSGVSYVLSSAAVGNFAGFISTSGAIHSITITPFGAGAAGTYASTDHVQVGVIPSPAVLALGALAGMVSRRRRS